VVSGFPVDDAAVGPTPSQWGCQPDPWSTTREEIWLVLCAMLLGDIFGWATQQHGALIHDICPARGDEHSQLGSGSSDLLWWHTEEAFQPYRCDYLGLMCLRNNDRTATTYASVADVRIDDRTRDLLLEERFLIRPDDSHIRDKDTVEGADGKAGRLLEEARERIEKMNADPEPVPVLYGDPDAPYLSIDPFYMEVADRDDAEARAALDEISVAIDAHLREVVLAPGEILFIDNFRAVHGRRPFRARFDGTDRWLKRVNIARDLRKSRAARLSSESRVIF
jgi:Fe(II)/alpha-ketoglutarate-dependent arginine beta-hydroxylase